MMGRRGLAPALAMLVAMAAIVAPAPARASFADHADPVLRALWIEGLALERREELLESTRRYEAIAEVVPGSAFIHWRIARNYWRFAERLPMDDKQGRLGYFGRADDWAGRSLEIDEGCGECVLWKVAALGRLATTRGLFQAAGSASTIADLIERGIALNPDHSDDPRNVTLANLYYAGAAFYRIVPDWIWLRLVIGVRGDRQRALEYIHRAIEISEPRVDYQVELGAVLLCMGTEDAEVARVEEGREVLRAALALDDYQSTDHFDREHAAILLVEPGRACGYSRDGWIDMAEAAKG
jgi:tetratricopeptide (TPR) repeat protein